MLRIAKRYVRVWWAFVKSCLAREMSYRTSLYMGLVRNLIWLGMALVNIEILFYHTDAIAGWTKLQMLLLLGLARLAQSLTALVFRSNMFGISSYIMNGQMDYILLKPISSQFTATFRYVRIHMLPHVLINVGLVAYALKAMGRAPSWGQALAFGVLFAAGLAMLYAFWLSLATLSFWLIRQAPNIAELFDTLYDAAQYPRSIFSDALQFVVTYVVPLAFVTIFPAQALSQGIHWTYAAGSIPLASLMLVLSSRIWRLGTRSYTSASS